MLSSQMNLIDYVDFEVLKELVFDTKIIQKHDMFSKRDSPHNPMIVVISVTLPTSTDRTIFVTE
jgi:hypothetical protein